MSVADALNKSELFGGLEPRSLEKISTMCRGRSYQEGTTIFREGDEAKELFVLTEGRIVLELEILPVPNRPAIPTAVEVVTKGEGFGWSALVEPHVYTLSARCMTNCQVVAIKSDLLRNLMADDVALGYELMKRLAKLIAMRLTHTRLRLTSGLGLILLGRETDRSERPLP